MGRTSVLLACLFVINLGVALGAGLYEGRIVVPRWIGPDGWNPAAAQADDTGVRFWVFVTTVPLTLLTLTMLVVAWRSTGAARPWLIAGSVAALLDRAMTLGYFIPTMVRLVGMPDSAQARAIAEQWAQLNNVRHVFVAIALIATLRALTR